MKVLKIASASCIFLSLGIAILTGCSSSTSGGGNGNDGGNGGGLQQGKDISISSSDSYKPAISADSTGNVYVVWEEEVGSSKKEVYLAASGNSGSTFSTRKSLTKDEESSCSRTGLKQEDVAIATGGGNSVYLAWVDSYQPSVPVSEVKLFHEEDAACSIVSTSFTTGRNVYSPHIGLNDDTGIHMVWAEDVGANLKDIFYIHSEDSGATFLPAGGPVNLSDTPSDSSEPLLAFFEGSLDLDVDAVWTEGSEGDRSVTFVRSTDNGENFSDPLTVSDMDIDSHCPVIATRGEDKLFITYQGGNDIYFTRWLPLTSSFSDAEVISPNSNSPLCPDMKVGANGTLYVLWEDSGGIWVAASTDNGSSFTVPKDVSSKTGTSVSPKMAIDGSYINLVWMEDEEGSGDIFFSGSSDNGKNFSAPRNISNSSSPSRSPAISADGKNYIHVAWEEGAEGSREIYYERDAGARGTAAAGEESLARFLDISGDGMSDIVIGAPEAGTADAGAVYVFYSNSMQFGGADELTSAADYTLSEGSSGDAFGFSAVIAGDVNADGYADILVGAPYADMDADTTDSGKVYVYYGGPSSLMNATPDLVINGSESNEHLGYAVSPAGDVNADGFDDIIIGTPDKYQSGIPYAGGATIFYGGPSLVDKTGYPASLSAGDADVILKGENSQDKFGKAVSRAGDFNHDGYDDVMVGAPEVNGGGINRGRVYLFYGGPFMNSAADVKITGEANLDQLGSSIAKGGDVNNDGYGDVIIGAPGADVTGDNLGRVYVIYGGSSVNPEINLASTSAALTVLSGLADNAFFGYSVGYAGDINKDGYSDIVVGGKYLGLDESFKGRAYAFFGGASMSATPGVTLIGENQGDWFGSAVAGAGDVDGDGHDDLLVGAYLADGSGTDRGRSYLYLGGDLTYGVTRSVSDADASFTGAVDSGWAGYSLHRGN